MPSDYSPELRIQLMQTGEKSGLWGDITNVNWELVEAAISGVAVVTSTAPDTILTASNGIADQARCAIILLDGSPGGAFNVFAPPESKTYIVKNNTASTASIYCSTVLGNNTPAGTAYTLPAGRTAFIRTNGVTFFDAIDHLDVPLPADSGGTGNASYAVGDLLYANTTTSLARLADVATGNVLRSGGVNTAPAWGQVNLATDVTGNLPVNNLGGGTGASSTTFWRGDGTWQTPGGGGDVSFTGTAPTASVNQVAVYGATGTAITTGGTYQFRAATGAQAQLQLFENPTNGTDSVIIQTPAALGASYTLTLPTTAGTAGYVLQTNGSGVLSWVAVASGTGDVTGPASSTTGAIPTFSSTTGKVLQNNSAVTISSGTISATGFSGSGASLTSLNASNISSGTLNAARLPSAAVQLSGTQTLTGAKTFTGGITSTSFNFDTNDSLFWTGSEAQIRIGGNMRFFVNNTTAGFSISDVQKVGGGSFNSYSDNRYKQDISAYNKGLAELKQIAPRNYRYTPAFMNADNPSQFFVGVIAQELEGTAFANCVKEDANGYKLVDTSELTYALINAVKELSDKVEQLETRLANM